MKKRHTSQASQVSSIFGMSLVLALQLATLCPLRTSAKDDAQTNSELPKAIAAEKSNTLISPRNTLTIPGTVSFLEVSSDETDHTFCTKRPSGPHFLTLGDHLYLSHETLPQLERIKGLRNHPFVMRDSVEQSQLYIPKTTPNSWDAWTIEFSRALADEWKSNVPGKQQVVLKVDQNQRVELLQSVAFVPAVDTNGRFVTRHELPTVEEDFAEAIESALERLSNSGKLRFPTGSTATNAIVTFTFNVDSNLDVWLPDLRTVKTVPEDQKSQWIARICTILDAGCIYKVSDALRSQLPAASQIHFIDDNSFRSLHSIRIAYVSGEPMPQTLVTKEGQEYLLSSLKNYLKEARYREAELLAKYVASDCFLKTHWRSPPPPTKEEHGNFSDDELDLAYVQAKRQKIEYHYEHYGWDSRIGMPMM